jgi:hypothetical protein
MLNVQWEFTPVNLVTSKNMMVLASFVWSAVQIASPFYVLFARLLIQLMNLNISGKLIVLRRYEC